MPQAQFEDIDQDEAIALLGSRDENVRAIRELLAVKIVMREGVLTITGDEADVDSARRLVARMRSAYRSHASMNANEIRAFLSDETPAKGDGDAASPSSSRLDIKGPVQTIRTRTPGQARYLSAVRKYDVTFCIGPAGTGKTYLAVAAALESMHQGQTKRLVLVRPAVEAGEKLGFLPGDLEAKVNPFLRPLLDALRDMIDFHQVKSYMDNDIVEIAPLAYMRGRTLNHSFIILDEGQNTTIPQMKMFLTRMGIGSKIIVTGDITQVDLPSGIANGMSDAVNRLGSLPRIGLVRLQSKDIVRHPLVEAIVDAYESPPGQ